MYDRFHRRHFKNGDEMSVVNQLKRFWTNLRSSSQIQPSKTEAEKAKGVDLELEKERRRGMRGGF